MSIIHLLSLKLYKKLMVAEEPFLVSKTTVSTWHEETGLIPISSACSRKHIQRPQRTLFRIFLIHRQTASGQSLNDILHSSTHMPYSFPLAAADFVSSSAI